MIAYAVLQASAFALHPYVSSNDTPNIHRPTLGSQQLSGPTWLGRLASSTSTI